MAKSCPTLPPHELQHTGFPSPLLSPQTHDHRVSDAIQPSYPSSIAPFSSCHQSFPATGSFPMSQLFTTGGQSIGASASASVLPVNIQCLFSLGFTGLIFL